jgi:hypothetical protein
MKTNIVSTSVFVAVFSITTLGVLAQSSYPQADKQKPSAQADKEKPNAARSLTMTGCLEKGADPTTFTLSGVEEAGPKTVQLHADASKKLAAHVGHKIAVTGAEMDPATIKKGTAGTSEPGAAPTPGATPAPGAAPTTPGAVEHHVQVESLKMISATCK